MPRWSTLCGSCSLAIGLLAAGTCHAGNDAASSRAGAVTITFDGVAAGAFTYTKEYGFTVSAPSSQGWVGWTSFGDPAPSIDVTTAAGVKATHSVLVERSGRTFTFTSVSLYSSVTTIPYRFRGVLNGLTKYVVTGTVPNTFGNFAKVTNPDASVAIDKLFIAVTNPATCCSNPEGIDNIVVTPVASSAAAGATKY